MYGTGAYQMLHGIGNNKRNAALQASYLWERVRNGGLRGWLRRRHYLCSLGEIARQRHDSHFAGAQTVALDHITGSENKSDAFDAHFRPLNDASAGRWQGIAAAWMRGDSLPPVELIRVGDRYYVRDGHHRISVARALGQRDIDAVVTVWDVAR
ncbi:MAG: hypothetical protein JW910_18775 [Anaerolineae bacterium]|nr:hypothetical protein [Anaerolineae bacterium]